MAHRSWRETSREDADSMGPEDAHRDPETGAVLGEDDRYPGPNPFDDRPRIAIGMIQSFTDLDLRRLLARVEEELRADPGRKLALVAQRFFRAELDRRAQAATPARERPVDAAHRVAETQAC